MVGKYELSEGEWEIIRVVWEKEPCAAPEVQESLKEKTGWSYSTVKTMMDRMVKKGFLVTEKMRNLILYSSAIGEQEAKSKEVMKTVRRAFEGAMTPMMQFLLKNENISDDELAELEELIKSRKKNR